MKKVIYPLLCFCVIQVVPSAVAQTVSEPLPFVFKDTTNTFGEQRIEPQGFLPPIEPIMDIPMRDPHATLGPDGFYYLTGTQPPDDDPTHNFWSPYNGIRMFQSADLVHWTNLGYVYTLRDNGTWQLTYKPGSLLPSFVPDQAHPKPTIWGPDPYYINGTWWIAYSLAYNGWGTCNGLLKSTSGKPTGPYVDVNANGPIVNLIDPGLFQADDGRVFYVYCDGRLALMNSSMNALVETPIRVAPSDADEVAFEGGALREINGRFYMQAAGNAGYALNYHGQTTYDMYVASSDNEYGPYGPTYIGIRNGGHNVMFRGKNNRWYATFFGWNPMDPFNEKPGILPVELDDYAHVAPYYDHFSILVPDARVKGADWKYATTAPTDDWTALDYDDSRWNSSQGGFGKGNAAREPVPTRTAWVTPEIWLRRGFYLSASILKDPQISLDIFHTGATQVYVNGIKIYDSPDHQDYYREDYPLSPQAKATLVAGRNIVAIHSFGENVRFIDAGLRLFMHTVFVPVSLHQPVSVSSSSDALHGGSNAVDGDLSSSWAPGADDKSPTLIADLGKLYDITRTDTYFDTPKQWHHYVIDYSTDRVNWQTYYHDNRPVNGDPCYTDVFDNGITADHVVGRYVRLILADSQNDPHPAIDEFSVYGHPHVADNDLARGAVVTASSAVDRFPAKNVADGYWGSIWRANGGAPAWVTLDLGKVQDIHEIKTWFGSPGIAYRYRLDTSVDNQDWTVFADQSANTLPNDPFYEDYAAVSARYIRLTVLGASDNVAVEVRDIKVYGAEAPIPAAVPNPEKSIVGHWKFDETSGTIASDSSGQGNDGVLSGKAGWTANGKLNGALAFAGGTVATKSGPGISFTASFWVKTSDKGSSAGGEPLVSSVDGIWKIVLTDGKLGYSTSNKSFSSADSINDGVYHAVAVTRTASGTTQLLVDGNVEATEDAPTVIPQRQGLVFGSSNFTGTLDDIVVYGQSLAANEIAAIEVTPATLVDKWNFVAANGSFLHSSVGAPNDVMLVGNPVISNSGVNGGSITFGADTSYATINRPVQEDFSIAFWVKTTQTVPPAAWFQGAWLVNGEMPGDTNDFGTSLSGGKFVFGTGEPDTSLTSDTAINDGTWHYCVATRSRGTGLLKVYVDGKLDGTQTAGTATLTAPSVLYFGNGGANHFIGSLSDIEIYDGILTSNEIDKLYESDRSELSN